MLKLYLILGSGFWLWYMSSVFLRRSMPAVFFPNYQSSLLRATHNGPGGLNHK
jgi:hypothetical protein